MPKYAKICIPVMVSSVLRITSQVEHTTWQWKQWKQVCEAKRRSSLSANSVFLHVTLVLSCGKKPFLTWTERSDANRWVIKYAWLFQSIGGLQQLFCQCFTNKCCQKYEFYHRKGYRKSNAIRITAIMFSTLWRPLYPFFSEGPSRNKTAYEILNLWNLY